MFLYKINLYLHFCLQMLNFSGISRGLCFRAYGQFTPARTVGLGEVEGLRQNLVALAIFLGFSQWLHDVLWRGQPQANHPRRQRNLHDWIFESCAAGRRRDPHIDFEQPAFGEAIFQFDPAAGMDACDERAFPISQDEESTGASYVRR